jgi:hypothetical protein
MLTTIVKKIDRVWLFFTKSAAIQGGDLYADGVSGGCFVHSTNDAQMP